MKVLSLGYDLGDGETIVDGVVFKVIEVDGQQKFETEEISGFRMPGSIQDGEAIPTGFGYNERQETVLVPSITVESEKITDIHAYFKRKPTDILGTVNETRFVELMGLFKDGLWPKDESTCKEFSSEEFNHFRKSVRIFTDIIFSNEKFQDSINFNLAKCDEVVFCVGHPTKWSELDRLIYKAILNETILGKGTYLGKKSSLILAAESRAAYLYMREKTSTASLNQNECSLLIDVGSSTIDITAVTHDSRNSQYNSGDNCLGVRVIDYLIKEWYIKNLEDLQPKYVPNPTAIYQDTISRNPAQETALVLICRKAKEEAFSAGAGQIVFALLFPTKLTPKIIDELAENAPIVSALKEIAGISDSEIANLNNQAWTELFRNFLEVQKAEIERRQLKIGRVIMTGSATRMDFVPKIIKQVFSEISNDALWLDSNPSRTISRGLALVGPSDAKSKHFQERMKKLNEEDIPRIIKDNLASLADNLAPVVENIVTDIVLANVGLWRSGYIITIDEMIADIKTDLSEKRLVDKLSGSDKYKTALKNWTVDTLGKDIALQLKAICDEYNVHEFSLDSLNVMTNVAVNPGTGNIEVNPLGGVVDFVGGIVAIIGGIITLIIFPSIAFVVGIIITSISSTLGSLLFAALVAIGPVGLGIIAAVAAVAAGVIIWKGVEGFKQVFNEKVRSYDLPNWVRTKITDDDIKGKIAAANIKGKIKSALLEDKNKKKIVNAVSNAITEQVKQRTDAIKFCIESR